MKDVGGAVLAGSTPPFLGRERAAVDVDVGPERRSPRYHETYLALESIKEGSAAVSKPRGVWLRMPIVKNLEEARRLPVRVEEQQAQQLAVNLLEKAVLDVPAFFPAQKTQKKQK